MLGKRCECHVSSEITIINGFPVSQKVWHAKEFSLLDVHEYREKVKICSPSPVVVTSPYEGKFSSEMINPKQTNKQTNKKQTKLTFTDATPVCKPFTALCSFSCTVWRMIEIQFIILLILWHTSVPYMQYTWFNMDWKYMSTWNINMYDDMQHNKLSFSTIKFHVNIVM